MIDSKKADRRDAEISRYTFIALGLVSIWFQLYWTWALSFIAAITISFMFDFRGGS